jgi:truncated hemoglobin YjbI
MSDSKTSQAYASMRAFLGLGAEDGTRLAAFLPRVEHLLPEITERFYQLLLEQDNLGPLVAGRIDRLKQTHTQWLRGLFSGSYDQDYFQEQMRVGFVHVKVNLDSVWVDAVMSVLRRELHAAVLDAAGGDEEASAVYGSLIKVIDLSLMTINMAYNEHRMQLLHEVTGMPEALIERLIRISADSD